MYCRSSGEKLIKYQANSSCVIMSWILMITLFYKTLILQEEIWCWKGELRRNCSPIGTIIQTLFVPNQEPASAWIFGNSSVRVGTQGLFYPYLKTFRPAFSPDPEWLPLGLRGWEGLGCLRHLERFEEGMTRQSKAKRGYFPKFLNFKINFFWRSDYFMYVYKKSEMSLFKTKNRKKSCKFDYSLGLLLIIMTFQ